MAEKAQPYEIAVYDDKVKTKWLEVGDIGGYNKEILFAIQAFRNNDTLQKCDEQSIKNAIINVALTGATLNPALQEAFLIPRKGKCCLDFSYRGLIGIACSHGSVKDMSAQVVYTWDDFDYAMGSQPFLRYKMCLNPPVDMDAIAKDPVKIWDHVVCAFSTATLLDGSVNFVILPKYKLWKIYQTSEGKDNAKMPWRTWPEEQIRKTVIKYHSKTLPKQANEQLATAVQVLNEHEGLASGTKAQDIMKRFGIQNDNSNAEDDVVQEFAPLACPNNPSTTYLKSHCETICTTRKGCPVWA